MDPNFSILVGNQINVDGVCSSNAVGENDNGFGVTNTVIVAVIVSIVGALMGMALAVFVIKPRVQVWDVCMCARLWVFVSYTLLQIWMVVRGNTRASDSFSDVPLGFLQ